MGQAIGSIIVGFDQQICRTLPPAQELVVKSKPVRGLSGQAPGLEVTFPDDDDPVPTINDEEHRDTEM
jgi:hypothetical protein